MKTKWAIGIDYVKGANVGQKPAPPFFKGRWATSVGRRDYGSKFVDESPLSSASGIHPPLWKRGELETSETEMLRDKSD